MSMGEMREEESKGDKDGLQSGGGWATLCGMNELEHRGRMEHHHHRRGPQTARMGMQLPLYRWMGWLSVLAFAIGLGVMYFLEGFIGIPAPLAWAGIVILVTVGTLLLNRPKWLLWTMVGYFMLLPGNRFLGIIQLPLPGFLDELLFVPMVAVIVMYGIEGKLVRGGGWFPLVFGVVILVSWYVNGKSYAFPTIRVALVLFKPFIVWYYCRLIRPMRTLREIRYFLWFYIIYAAIQFPFNVLWTGSVKPQYGFAADRCTGLCGPGSHGAHLIGYISLCALFMAAGWMMGGGFKKLGFWKKVLAAAVFLVVAYDMVFMTGTKHILFMGPIAFVPFLLHPRIPMRLRASVVGLGVLVVLMGSVYLSAGTTRLAAIWETFVDSPKGEMYRAVTKDFHFLVPYPLLGAGPAKFASDQAVRIRTPLARRYILPYMDEERRRAYYGLGGTTKAASMLGSTNADCLAVVSETGWLGGACYYLFYGLIVWGFWRRSMQTDNLELSGQLMALTSCLLFCVMLTFIYHSFNIQMLSYPLWILAGTLWDAKDEELEGTKIPAAEGGALEGEVHAV